MITLDRVSTVASTVSAYLDGVTDIEAVWSGGQMSLFTVGRATQGLAAFEATQGGTLELFAEAPLVASLSNVAEPQLTFLSTAAGDMLLTTGLNTFGPYAQPLVGGSFAAPTYWADPSGSGFRMSVAQTVQTSQGQFLFSARSDVSGLSGFELTATAAEVTANVLLPIATAAAHTISDIAAIGSGASQHLITALPDEDRLVSYSIAENGSLSEVQSYGAADGFGISVPADLATVRFGGADYLLLASSQSSTISVFRLEGDGMLTATDNIVDSLSTRFATASHVDAVAAQGRSFIVASGGDDGISVFTLLPGGRLFLLASFSDTATTTLKNVSALACAVLGQELQVYVTSGAEAGLTQFAFDLSKIGLTVEAGAGDDLVIGGALDDILAGGAGNDTVIGGSGADILMDGAGQDALTGGAGGDVFVFAPDGQLDTVLDFNPALDRLDLSAFALLYDLNQLTVTPTAWGAQLRYENETIDIYSVSGQTLTVADFSTASVLNLMRSPDTSNADPIALQGSAHADTIVGGIRDELIFGYSECDLLYGGGGYDTLFGGGDHDWLEGGPGDDILRGDGGRDTLLGGDGDDDLDGGWFNDRLEGGKGNDTLKGDGGLDALFGGEGNDILFGGDANDALYGGRDHDRLEGGMGNDVLRGEGGRDTLLGGDGDDDLDGGWFNDRLEGGQGNDTLKGDGGLDALFGDEGNDILFGGDADDALYGGRDHDRLEGGAGNDVLRGEGGRDTLLGGDGDDHLDGGWFSDWLNGGNGNDTVRGDGGHDRLFGGSGDDNLLGGDGNDTLFGAGDDDTLTGGAGNDRMAGEAGADIFIFADGFGDDVITDFDALDALEKIDLSGLSTISDYTALLASHLTQVGGDVILNDLAGNTITLTGVNLVNLDGTDFIF